MTTRREFLTGMIGLAALPLVVRNAAARPETLEDNLATTDSDKEAATTYIFSQIMKRATQERWSARPMSELMGSLGMLLLGTKYEGGTLEGPGQEVCRIDLTGLDCVTFFENVLGMARIIKKETPTYEAFMREVTFTRYRDGKLTDYTSRLHYTAEWIANNVNKGVVQDVTQEIGGVPLTVNVNFMSQHPQYYPALKESPELVEKITLIEQQINARQFYYIPTKDIKAAQKGMRTGDIVAIATDKAGLDYAHTGLIHVDKKGKVRFLHASLKKKKVYWDTELYQYVKSVKSDTGVTIVRPLEV